MLLHLPITILLTLSPIHVSDSVPQFDIARECHFEGGSTDTFDRCSQDEGAALRNLQQAWTQFLGADKRNCTVEATTSGFASYVELLTCLEMVRDLVTTNHNPDPRARSEMRPTQPGRPSATVGEGH